MNNGAYAGLRLAARAAKPDPEADPNETEPDGDPDDTSASNDGKGKEKKPMDTNCEDTAVAQAVAAERTRNSTVLASEHYAGREKLAASLLSTDLSADQIVAALAAAGVPASAERVDTDASARAEMREAIDETQNSALDASASGAGGTETKDYASVWDGAIAANNPGVKLG